MKERYNNIPNKHIYFISGLIFFLLINAMLYYSFYHQNQIGPEQPIHFSHRVHVNDKHISCFMCHQTATTGRRAGIPAVQTCMLCHQKIIIKHKEIQNLSDHYYQNRPLMWARAQEKTPDFVFFNHSVHIFRKVDCGACHGNVKEMDRVKEVHKFKMGFCIDCHKLEKASVDCYTCHR